MIMKYKLHHIIFEVTPACNLSCLYCYNYWRREKRQPASSGFRQADKTLKKLFKIADFGHITFTGGEPFLAEGLAEHVLRCRLKGKNITVISNGTTAACEDYKLLVDMGVSLFELPLHSDKPEVHDGMTTVPGCFNKVVRSLNILTELKAEICTVIVLTKLNCDRMYETLQFAESLGVIRVMLARFNIGGNGISNRELLLPSLAQLKSAFTTANDYRKKNRIQISANVCVPQCIINPADYPRIPISSCGSNLKTKPVTVDASGNVRICNHSPVVLGNIHTDTFEEMFSTPYTRAWESELPEYCMSCSYGATCRGGCRAASEQMGNPMNTVDPIVSYYLREAC